MGTGSTPPSALRLAQVVQRTRSPPLTRLDGARDAKVVPPLDALTLPARDASLPKDDGQQFRTAGHPDKQPLLDDLGEVTPARLERRTRRDDATKPAHGRRERAVGQQSVAGALECAFYVARDDSRILPRRGSRRRAPHSRLLRSRAFAMRNAVAAA